MSHSVQRGYEEMQLLMTSESTVQQLPGGNVTLEKLSAVAVKKDKGLSQKGA